MLLSMGVKQQAELLQTPVLRLPLPGMVEALRERRLISKLLSQRWNDGILLGLKVTAKAPLLVS